jgi:hypothetical protein
MTVGPAEFAVPHPAQLVFLARVGIEESEDHCSCTLFGTISSAPTNLKYFGMTIGGKFNTSRAGSVLSLGTGSREPLSSKIRGGGLPGTPSVADAVRRVGRAGQAMLVALGVPFQTFEQWKSSGARVPAAGQGRGEGSAVPPNVSHAEDAAP